MGIRLIKISVVYFVIGICLGMYMNITHVFNLMPVHAHINLVGWVTLTLAGLLYVVFPATEQTKLAKWHFWLHNIGLPVMMIGLSFVLYGNQSLVPVVAAGAVILSLGVILFAINIIKNVTPTARQINIGNQENTSV